MFILNFSFVLISNYLIECMNFAAKDVCMYIWAVGGHKNTKM